MSSMRDFTPDEPMSFSTVLPKMRALISRTVRKGRRGSGRAICHQHGHAKIAAIGQVEARIGKDGADVTRSTPADTAER